MTEALEEKWMTLTEGFGLVGIAKYQCEVSGVYCHAFFSIRNLKGARRAVPPSQYVLLG